MLGLEKTGWCSKKTREHSCLDLKTFSLPKETWDIRFYMINPISMDSSNMEDLKGLALKEGLEKTRELIANYNPKQGC